MTQNIKGIGMRYSVDEIIYERSQGVSIKDISSKHGVSTRTVHRVLAKCGDDISTTKGSVVDVIYALAKRGKGITHQEEWDILVSLLGDSAQDSKKGIRRAVREKAVKEGVSVTFVPNWLDTSNVLTPRSSQHLMLELAHELQIRIEESVDVYMQQTGNTHSDDIRHALLTYAVQNYGNVPLGTFCDRVDSVVEGLERV